MKGFNIIIVSTAYNHASVGSCYMLYIMYFPAPPPQDAVAMVNHMQFNPMYKPAVLQVFSKTLICRDMEKASHYAKNANMDCITLEGGSSKSGLACRVF